MSVEFVRGGSITEKDLEDIKTSPKFIAWFGRLTENKRVVIERIVFNHVNRFGPAVGFVNLTVHYKDELNPKAFPCVVFLSGGSICVLIKLIAKETGEAYLPLAIQTRLASTCEDLVEIFAGMNDNNTGSPLNVALHELKEEFTIKDISDGKADGHELIHLGGFYTSPGRCDEYITAYYLEMIKPLSEIQELIGAKTGERHLGEVITVKIVPWNEGHLHTQDCKYFSSMFLLSKK